MIPPSIKSFVYKLKGATDRGELQWIKSDNEVFICSHKHYTLFLSQSYDEQRDLTIYRFRVKDLTNDATFMVTDREEDFDFMRTLDDAVDFNAASFVNIEQDFFGS